MATLPPGVELPEGVTLPPGLADLPPGATIPPGILDSLVNGTADGGEIPTDINDLLTGGGLGGEGGAALDDFDFINLANATPFFLPQTQIPYDKAPSTNAMSGIPRFGHPHDFSFVAYLITDNGNPSDGEDYMVGLLFTGLFLLVFFSIWSAVLIIFKMCLNGFLCGDPFLNPWIDDPAEKKRKDEILEDGEEYIEDANWKKQPFRIRITFFIAGLLQIIFAMLMVTKGVNNLQQTTDTVQLSTGELRLLVDEAVQTIDDLKQVGDTGYILRDQLVFDLDKDNFCPDNPIFEQTQAGKDVLASTDGAVTVLAQMGDFIGENIVTLEESMADARRNLDEVDEAILEAEENEWLGELLWFRSAELATGLGSLQYCKLVIQVSHLNPLFYLLMCITGGLIAFPYLVLSSLMMIGAIAAQLHAMTDCFLCVLNWVILPLFIFITFVSFVMLSMMSIAASANADFCGGESSTPDQVLIDIMFRSGFDEDDLFFQMVRYYTNQCTAAAVTDPFLFLRGFDGSIVSTSNCLL